MPGLICGAMQNKPSHATGISASGSARRTVLVVAALLLSACGTSPHRGGRGTAPAYSRLTPEQSNDIAIHAMGLVGTPYRYGGNTPEGGFDCSGLIGYVYLNSVGEAPPRTVARMASFGAPVAMSELRTGDLVLFGASTPSHAGIYVGNGRFVHAPSTGGVVRLDRLDGVYWSRQVVQARRP